MSWYYWSNPTCDYNHSIGSEDCGNGNNIIDKSINGTTVDTGIEEHISILMYLEVEIGQVRGDTNTILRDSSQSVGT